MATEAVKLAFTVHEPDRTHPQAKVSHNPCALPPPTHPKQHRHKDKDVPAKAVVAHARTAMRMAAVRMMTRRRDYRKQETAR